MRRKAAHPEHETTGGYLKSIPFKAACALMWKNLSKDDKHKVLEIPNFDADIFYRITGIFAGGWAMCNELVQRLREPCQYENCVLCQKAADAIEALSMKLHGDGAATSIYHPLDATSGAARAAEGE